MYLATAAYFVVTSLMFLGGTLSLIGRYAQVSDWIRVKGRVIANERDPKPVDFVGFRPVIEMTVRDAAGERMVTWSPSSYTYPPDYKVGDSVPMLYDPSDPSNALIDNPEKWIWPALFCASGLFLLLVGLGVQLGYLTTD